MRLYNQNTDKIETVKVIETASYLYYTDKLTDDELNDLGYYKVEYQSKPDRQYYSSVESGELINNKYRVSYLGSEKNLDEVKARMLKDLKVRKLEKQDGRPVVDTGLGFSVDGGYRDMQNLEGGKALGLTFCKDVDGINQSVELTDWDNILMAVRSSGLSIILDNADKKDEIAALADVEACIEYEATPYTEMVDVIDEETREATGETKEVTKYRNNVKEW